MSDITHLVVTNQDLWNALVAEPGAVAPLVELVKLDTRLPASNILRRSLRLAMDAMQDVEAERVKLVGKYVTEVIAEDGTTAQRIDPEFFVEFQKLLANEVTLPGAQSVRVSELGNVPFSGAKLDAIKAFVVDG